MGQTLFHRPKRIYRLWSVKSKNIYCASLRIVLDAKKHKKYKTCLLRFHSVSREKGRTQVTLNMNENEPRWVEESLSRCDTICSFQRWRNYVPEVWNASYKVTPLSGRAGPRAQILKTTIESSFSTHHCCTAPLSAPRAKQHPQTASQVTICRCFCLEIFVLPL